MNDAQPVSAEEAVELFMTARRHGEHPDPALFAAQYAHLGSELREALGALAGLERVTPSGVAPGPVTAERVGPYRIVREIGRGGMGVVLEAVEEPLGRRVALKVLPAELLSSASARARFKREAELAARLDHPAIATVYGAGVESERPWIAMRFVEGETLAQAISAARMAEVSSARVGSSRGGGRDGALAVAAMIAKVARALAAAHEHGVVHRDVKPSNIILARDGTPTLVDFGLAIPEDSEGHTLTRTGENAGTPAYMSPEILAGEAARSDAQSDVYSLGVTLYEALTLRRPFDAPTPVALQRAILSSTPTAVRSIQRSVSRDLATVLATAMERDRGRRYRSAAAFAGDLEACATGRSIQARPLPFYGRLARWSQREPLQAWLGGLLLFATLVTAVASGSWWQGRKQVQAAANMRARESLETALQQGYGHLAVNWIPEAEADFLRALALQPGNVEAVAGRTIIALKERRPELLQTILADAHSPAFDALRELGEGGQPALDQGEAWFANAPAVEMFVDGMRLMRQLESSPPPERRRIAELALVRFNEAVSRSSSPRMFYHLQRALAARQTRDEKAIRSAAASLVVLWPELERAQFTAGLALASIDPADSIPYFERAIELDPNWGAPYQNLAEKYFEQGRPDDALRVVRRALELDPRDADALNSLGRFEHQRGCTDEACAAYRAAIEVRPWQWESWGNLAILNSRDPNSSTAEFEFRTALTSNPYEPLLYQDLGALLLRKGRAEDARAEYQTLVGLYPREPEGWAGLSRAELSLGAVRAALDAAEVGLQRSPEHVGLREAHAAALQAAADPDAKKKDQR